MKHLLLSLVCAGLCLAATAAVPRVNRNVKIQDKTPARTFVIGDRLKRDKLRMPMPVDPMTAITPQNFFSKHGVTPTDNRLLKKAPRRVSADDLLDTKLGFMIQYEYDSDVDDVVMSPDYMWGGWEVYMEQYDDNWFGAYLMYSQIPFDIYVDYAANTAEMVMESLAGWQWSDTVVSGRTTSIYDTTEYVCIFDENYMLSEDWDSEPANLIGDVYEDGSIYFPDGWCIYTVQFTQQTVTRSGRTTVTYDTIENISGFYHDTYLMTPNAVHEYDIDGGHYGNYAYMYQYDDTTAVVWNLWQLGGRGSFMYIHEDGSMVMPVGQIVATSDVAELVEEYGEYDWSVGYDWNLYGYDIENDDYSVDDIQGTVTRTELAWDASLLVRYCLYNGQYYALFYPPLLNNKMTFINGEQFVFGYAAKPELTVTEGDYAYTFQAVPAEEGTVPYLYTYDPTYYTIGDMVDNPYVVERTTEDQVVYLAAYADGYGIGKNPSDWVVAQFVVPALEILRGDLNGDGMINLLDLMALEDVLLNDAWGDVNSDVADINGDGTIDLKDITAMIKLLNGE